MSELAINPLATIAAGVIERAANTALGLDPIAAAALAELHGRKIGIECTEPAMNFEVTVADDTLRVLARSPEQPHVRVRGSAANLLAAASRDNPTGLTIDGDEHLVLELKSIFSRLEPDLARPLSGLIGERQADNLIGAGETALSLLGGLFKQLSSDATQSVGKRFSSNDDAEALVSRIESLRDRVDRLDARIQQRSSASNADQPNA